MLLAVKRETEHARAQFSGVCHPSPQGTQEDRSCISAIGIREGFSEEMGLELYLTGWAGLERRERRKEVVQAGREAEVKA